MRRVASSSVVSFTILVTGALLAYCSQMLIARTIGVDSYGIYSYVLAWATVLAYFCALGFDVALLRYIPAYRATESWSLLRGVTRYAEFCALAASIVVGVCGVTVLRIQSNSLSAELSQTFLIGFLLVPVLALLWLRCSMLRGYGVFLTAVSADRILREAILMALIVIAVVIIHVDFGAQAVMVMTLAGSTCGLVWAIIAERDVRPAAVGAAPLSYDCRQWNRTAAPLVIIAAIDILMNRMGLIWLGWQGNIRHAGIYGLAYSIAFIVALPRTAVNTLFAPTFSGHFARGEQGVLQQLVTRTTLWTFFAAIGIAVFLWVLASPLLRLFGPDFTEGLAALRILLVGQVIASAAGSPLFVMTMSQNERGAAGLFLASAVFNFLTTALFATWFGLVGAAIAGTMTLIVSNVAMMIFIKVRLNLLSGILGLLVRPHGAVREAPSD